MSELRITTILGTRPEIIRLSNIIGKLDVLYEHRLVHTGQNFSAELSEVFFEELGLRKPDAHFVSLSSTLGGFLSDLFSNLQIEFDNYRPDAVLILGDTNSALSGILAKRMGIPIYHLEAGNRSYDANVPEELNRKIVDHLADFNLAYTENAKDNLIREGIHPRNVIVIGSPLNEVIKNNLSSIYKSNVLNRLKLEDKEYFLVSAHRQENVDDPARLGVLMEALNAVAARYEFPVIVSLHPRTRDKMANSKIEINPLIKFHEPFGFFDYMRLQVSARVVISDSGSISEEAAILGFDAVTIRNSMERPEALEAGTILLSGIEPDGVLDALQSVESIGLSRNLPRDYSIPDTSIRVVNFIGSTIRQHSYWSGLRKNHEG
jgi:UDP-N-acetylglucosamine 2-epimerase